MWISVVIGVIGLAIGVLGLLAVNALASDPEIAAASAELPPMGLMWALMLISAALLVAQLILVIRIPRRQAATRTGIIVLFAVSAVISIATIALTSDYASNGISLALSAVLVGLLMSSGAKQYFTN